MSNTEPPMVDVWTVEDEEKLVRLSNKQIDMSETFLGRYAAIQKRTAVAAILNFTDEEWESLMALREADGAETNQVATANDTGDIMGSLLGTESENETAGGTINQGAA